MSSSYNSSETYDSHAHKRQNEIPGVWYPCRPIFEDFSIDELIVTCKCCGTYSVQCCFHPVDTVHGGKSCHHKSVVFVDGACINNGGVGPRSGVGCATGTNPEEKCSIPVDDDMDDSARSDVKRTSQRAELLAALEGLRMLEKGHWPKERLIRSARRRTNRGESNAEEPKWIIVSDSEYVVKGMTEWLPVWRENGMRTSQGKRPANLDLFLSLESAIKKHEEEKSVEILFWQVQREYNTVADRLAKDAARVAFPAGQAPRVERTGIAIASF